MFSVGVLGSGLFGESGVFADLFMGLGIHGFDRLSLGSFQALSPLGELFVKVFLTLFLELIHVVINMNSENTVSVDFGIISVLLIIISIGSRETLGVVRNIHSTVNSSLEGTEDTVTSGSGHQTNIQNGFERVFAIHIVVDHGIVFSVDFSLALVLFIQFVFLEKSTGAEKSSGIGSGVVGQTASDSVLFELGGLGLGNDLITFQSGEDDLADDLVGGDTGHKSVLRGVIFILILHGKTLTGIVVSFAFSSSAELGLEALEVGVVLVYFYESHKIINKSL